MTTAIEQPPEVLAALMTEQEAREVAGKIRRGIGELRRLLVEFKEREGWRALGYANLDDCCRAEFNIGRSHLYRQLAAAVVERNLQSPIGDNPESHLRPLAGKPPEVQRQAFAEASANGAPTAEKVRQAVERIEQSEPEIRGNGETRVVDLTPAATQSEPEQSSKTLAECFDTHPETGPVETCEIDAAAYEGRRASDLGEIEAAVLKRHGISVGKAAGYFAQVFGIVERGGLSWDEFSSLISQIEAAAAQSSATLKARLVAARRPGLK